MDLRPFSTKYKDLGGIEKPQVVSTGPGLLRMVRYDDQVPGTSFIFIVPVPIGANDCQHRLTGKRGVNRDDQRSREN